jgi:hypothetical protein
MTARTKSRLEKLEAATPAELPYWLRPWDQVVVHSQEEADAAQEAHKARRAAGDTRNLIIRRIVTPAEGAQNAA